MRAIVVALAVFTATPAVAQDVQCADAARAAGLVKLAVPGGKLTATIAPADGGQIAGLSFEGRELLYRGMNFCETPGWDGKAPILWPATGRSFAAPAEGGKAKAGGWTWQGKRYDMPIHGFARSMAWRMMPAGKGDGPASVRLRLTDTAATHTLYPFGFTHDVAYVLKGDTLTVAHRVTAARDNTQPMPFSIGNHITFAVDQRATVTTAATRRILLDASGRPTGVVEPAVPINAAPATSVSGDAALSLGGFGRNAALSLSLGDGTTIALAQHAPAVPSGDPVRFNLWGDVAKGYFAPEPWLGKQDSLNRGDGAIRLRPGASFDWTITITVDRRH